MSQKNAICNTCIKWLDPCDESKCSVQNGWKEWKIALTIPKHDTVKQPEHYTSGSVECIDAIKSALSLEEYRGYLKGNIMKYIFRERLKNKDEDIRKGSQYMEWLINSINKEVE